MTNDKKQTAVEWLESKMKEFAIDLDLLGYVEQAKAMERQQIIDAYHIHPLETKWQNSGFDYFNETYKQP